MQLTPEEISSVAATVIGLVFTGLGAWSFATLHATAQLVAGLKAKVDDHDEQHEKHELAAMDHERRISHVEGRLVRI